MHQLQRPFTEKLAETLRTLDRLGIDQPDRPASGKLYQCRNRVKGLFTVKLGIQGDHVSMSDLITGGIKRFRCRNPTNFRGQGHSRIQRIKISTQSQSPRNGKRPLNARLSVPPSTYSSSPPMGTP